MINIEKINKLLNHAYETVPFYKSLNDKPIIRNEEEFLKIPLITVSFDLHKC